MYSLSLIPSQVTKFCAIGYVNIQLGKYCRLLQRFDWNPVH